MRNLVSTTVVALLAAACGGATTEQDAASMRAAESERTRTTNGEHGSGESCGTPFHGPSRGTTVSTVQLPLVHNVFTGTAVLSGMGRARIVFPHDWNVVDKSVTGSMTITSASGDELYASVTGTALMNPDGLTMDLDQFGTIEGGTGRFEEAGGSFSIVGTLTRATGAVSVHMDGRLLRDPSCD